VFFFLGFKILLDRIKHSLVKCFHPKQRIGKQIMIIGS